MKHLIDLLNTNQGFIAALGLFLIVPLAIFSDRIVTSFRKRNFRKDLCQLLISELFKNLNYVSQVEITYNNNLRQDGIHIPHYPPSTHVIGKFFDYNLVSSISPSQRQLLTEIYDQLESLKHEYYLWKELLIKLDLSNNQEAYKVLSSSMISYVKPSMQNMLNFWLPLVSTYGANSRISQVRQLADTMHKMNIESNNFNAFYKSSHYKNENKQNVVFCWINDRDTSKVKVVELKDILSLHETWKNQIVSKKEDK